MNSSLIFFHFLIIFNMRRKERREKKSHDITKSVISVKSKPNFVLSAPDNVPSFHFSELERDFP